MKLFHVTYLYNLPSIQNRGLVPGVGQVFGGGYRGHSAERLFLTEEDGIDFWMNRYEELAAHHTDHPEEGWVPIVLEVRAKKSDLHIDEPGSEDARADSFYVEDRLPTACIIGVYDGERWVSLDDADLDTMLSQALAAAEVEEEDGEKIYWMDYEIFRPSS